MTDIPSGYENVRSSYINGLRSLEPRNLPPDTSVYLTGSFARDRTNQHSDMDIHLITSEQYPSFEDVKYQLETELSLRHELSRQFTLDNLARHYASHFSSKAYELHLKSLPWRYGFPLDAGEHYLAYGEPVKFTETYLGRAAITDLIITIDERLKHFGKSKRLSWLVWNQRDINHLSSGSKELRSYDNTKSVTFDGLVTARQVLKSQQEIANGLVRKFNFSESELNDRSLAHQLTWTAEKVAWELVTSSQDYSYFDQYRLSKRQAYGYMPIQIGKLILQTEHLSGARTLSKANRLKKTLTEVSESPQGHSFLIERLYSDLNEWVFSTLRGLLQKPAINQQRLN